MTLVLFGFMVAAAVSVVDDAARMASKIATADDREFAKFSSLLGVAVALACALLVRSRISDIDAGTALIALVVASAGAGVSHWRWRRRKAVAP